MMKGAKARPRAARFKAVSKLKLPIDSSLCAFGLLFAPWRGRTVSRKGANKEKQKAQRVEWFSSAFWDFKLAFLCASVISHHTPERIRRNDSALSHNPKANGVECCGGLGVCYAP
jgi:hypothetical protein